MGSEEVLKKIENGEINPMSDVNSKKVFWILYIVYRIMELKFVES